MSENTIVLVCAAGMSTSLLVKKIRDAAEANNYPAEVFAIAASDLNKTLENHNVNAVLLGPQVRFKLKDISAKLIPLGIPVAVIDMLSYGQMNGEKVLIQAQQLIEGK